MEIFGFFVPIIYIMAFVFALIVVGFWRLSNSEHEGLDPKKHWHPDADKMKAETIRNHTPGGGLES